jgi:peroxiredoxin
MALRVGDKAPDFTLLDTERQPKSLKDFLGKKTVVAFFPGAFTGACTREMCSFRDSLSAFNSMNAGVVAISVDSPFANKAFAENNKLGFPVLSDYTRETSNRYAGVYNDFGGMKGYTAARRAVFILDSTGTVTYAWMTENPGTEPNYDEIKKALA